MKSLLITYDFPPIVSGIGTFFFNVWSRLPKDRNVVLAPRVAGWEGCDRGGAIDVRRYPDITRSRLIRDMVLFPRIRRIMKKEGVSLLICGVPASIGFLGLVMKKLYGTKYGVFYYGGELVKYSRRKTILSLIKSVLLNADFIITNSEFTMSEAASYGVDKKKIHKITPAVDQKIFTCSGSGNEVREKFGLKDKKVILTVSRLIRRKGIEKVIMAMPRVLEEVPNAAYLIVGEGEYGHDLRSLAIDKDLSDNVIFAGRVTDEELPGYYSACDLFAMPNMATKGSETLEGFGISFIEASACGKPVIGGITGGVREAVVDGETGLLVDPLDTDALAAAIIKLLKDDRSAKEMGERGRRRVEMEFGWENRAKRMGEIIDAAMA